MGKQIKKLLIIGACIGVTVIANAQWDKPNHKTNTCAANTLEMAQMPELLNYMKSVDPLKGVDSFIGTWKFKNLLASAILSFDISEDGGFYVQSEDDPREAVSICLDNPDDEWIRVSVHHPACPENQNIYISLESAEKMKLKSYRSKILGAVTFKKKSDQPQPPGFEKAPVECKM